MKTQLSSPNHKTITSPSKYNATRLDTPSSIHNLEPDQHGIRIGNRAESIEARRLGKHHIAALGQAVAIRATLFHNTEHPA